MRTTVVIVGSLFTLMSVAITLFLKAMVDLVGQGDNFWTNGMVLLNILFWLIAIGCWVYVASGKGKRKKSV